MNGWLRRQPGLGETKPRIRGRRAGSAMAPGLRGTPTTLTAPLAQTSPNNSQHHARQALRSLLFAPTRWHRTVEGGPGKLRMASNRPSARCLRSDDSYHGKKKTKKKKKIRIATMSSGAIETNAKRFQKPPCPTANKIAPPLDHQALPASLDACLKKRNVAALSIMGADHCNLRRPRPRGRFSSAGVRPKALSTRYGHRLFHRRREKKKKIA